MDKAEFKISEDGGELRPVNFDNLPASERASARAALVKYFDRSKPIDVAATKDFIVKPEGMDARAAQWLRLLDTFGTASGDFMAASMGVLRAMAAGRDTDGDVNSVTLSSMVAMVDAIGPEDELEGALAVQMASCHKLASEMLSRASTSPNVDQVQMYANMAIKLQRTFTSQIEALARLRGGASQSVRVEHVHVHDGGQAIVGNVEAPAGGRGRGKRKSQVQPDAQAQNDEIPALRSPDTEGNGVPVAGDLGEEALPDARRH